MAQYLETAKTTAQQFVQGSQTFAKDVANDRVSEFKTYYESAKRELDVSPIISEAKSTSVDKIYSQTRNYYYVPYLPAFVYPGWLTQYAVRLCNRETVVGALEDIILRDFVAGITVAMTLIPQGLSYSTLANLPPIYGLYTAILPSAVYTFFGSSMALAVGPVSLMSLMMGSLVTSYGINWEEDPASAVDLAAEVSFCMGIILLTICVLNLGQYIRLLSHPVMSGFTTAAAFLIGLSQLKNAFGFTYPAVPQVGAGGITSQWQVMHWYKDHWNERYHNDPKNEDHLYKNFYATRVSNMYD